MTQLTDEQLANIAHDYYLSKLNIADISQKYSLSRYLITKALDDAQDKGIVKINIYQNTKRDEKLERKFLQLFDLKDVFILRNLDTKNQDNEAMVTFAAEQLQNYLKSAKVVGLTWGTLIRDIINNFNEENHEDLTFVQLLGQAVNSSKRKNPLIQDAAEKFNAKCLTLPAPLYAIHPTLIKEIQKEPFYQHIKNYYKKIDLLFASVGTLQSVESSQFFMKSY